MRLRSSSFDKKLVSSGRFSIKFDGTEITESIKVDVEKKSNPRYLESYPLHLLVSFL